MHIAPSLPTVSPAAPAGRFSRRRVAKRFGTLACAGVLAGGFASLLLGAAGCGLPEAETAGAAAEAPAPRRVEAQRCAATPPTALNIVGGDMVMEPECATKPAGPGGWPLGVNGRHILFTNYEGVDMQPGGTPGNSFENVGLRAMDLAGKGVIELPPYDADNPKRLDNILAIHKKLIGWYADMNVDIVISRPLTGDYLMTVVGGRQSDIVQKAGAFYSYKEQRLGQGADNAAKFLRENTTIRDTLVQEILEANRAKIAGIPIPEDQDGEAPELEEAAPAPAPKKRGRGADKGE